MPAKRRSREHPVISLRQAHQLARQHFDRERFNPIPVEAAVKLYGYKGMNGLSARVLSALRQYGLSVQDGRSEKREVRLSDRSRRISLPESEGEVGTQLREAIAEPRLFAEILEKYPDGLPTEKSLTVSLERHFELTPAAAKLVAGNILDGLS